jgi:hypothetical protein
MSTTTDVGGVDKHRDTHQNEHQQERLPPPPEPATGTAGHDGRTAPPVASPPASSPTSPVTSLRTSDEERAEVVERLHQALGAGCLDLAETDERVAAAYAARYRHELTALLSDLPEAAVTFTQAPSWAGLWTLAVWRMLSFLDGGAARARPTARQMRAATLLSVLAVAWVVACAIVGALVVGA